jgi:ferritin-like metal-binding protein YciE
MTHRGKRTAERGYGYPMRDISEQLVKYLTDAHSIEVQALAQMKAAPGIAGDPQLAEAFRAHLTETEEHERLVRERLQAHGAKPAPLKDLAGRVTGMGFVLFARSQPDTPGKLVTHGFSYEHMELAAYDLLVRVAERAGDAETAEVARRIRSEEETMAGRLGQSWDLAVEASLRDKGAEDVGEEVESYMTDAHAIEAQAIQLLGRAPKLAGTPELERVYREHLDESREHARLVEERLHARDAQPSRIKDAAMRLGALNWGGFFGAQPDTPAKLAAFSYAFEHLEIGGYEQLGRVAGRAGDEQTVAVVERILDEERVAAEKLFAGFEPALEASLDAVDARG